MTNVIADDLEVELGIDQSLYASVAQGVRTWATDINTRFAQVVRRAAGHSNRRHRSDGRQNPEKQPSLLDVWACIF